MSTRALRKLRGGDDELAKIAQLGKGSDSDEDDICDTPLQPITNKQKSKNKRKQNIANPFSLLTGDDNETDEVERQEAEPPVGEEIKPEGGAIRKTKQKKKKKKQKKQSENQQTNEQEKDIDATIREVNEMFGESNLQSDGLKTEIDNIHMKQLLAIEHKYLNADNEMKRIFGSRVVHANVEQNRRRNRGRPYHKSTWLAQPKESWPHLGKTGLSMSLLETKGGEQYFAFEHNAAYQLVQFQFLDAVESLNPQNIMAVLNMYPYHIDSLIQLSEVCRMGEDMQMATELIERALYVFEINFHPLFSLTQGNSRLDYKRPENRAFFIALFRHTLFVGQKGSNRTSLEFCKLLLGLDPENDPMAVLLMIDFYALRAEEYSFIIRMYQDWEGHRNLSQLPNFAFSVALAMYHVAQQENTSLDEADSMLQKALLMFPGVLIPLLDKCNVVSNKEVAAHAFFGTVTQLKQPVALKQLVALYVGRCHSCWKVPEVMTWMEENVRQVLARVDSGDPLVTEYETKTSARYHGTPRNILRHIIMSEVQDATAALPPEFANTPVLSYDPLPPAGSIVSYTRPARPTRVQQESGALSMFFRSLLPNYNPQELADDPTGAVGGQPANIREGVNLLMNAMRDLLQNIRPMEPPVENEDGRQEDQDDVEQGEWD